MPKRNGRLNIQQGAMLLGIPCVALLKLCLSGAISIVCMIGSSLISENVPSRAPGATEGYV